MIIEAGMPTSSRMYGPIDGCEDFTSRETRYSQPSGIPSHSRTDPIAMRAISRTAMSLRPIAQVFPPDPSLPGLPRTTVRAGDRRGDVGLEDVTARARVHGAIGGPAGFAGPALVCQVVSRLRRLFDRLAVLRRMWPTQQSAAVSGF